MVVLRPRASSSDTTMDRGEVKPSNVFTLLEVEDINLKENEDHEEDDETIHEGSSDKENVNQKSRRNNKKSKKPSGKGKKAPKSKKSEAQALTIQNPITDMDIFTPKNEYEIADDDEEEEFYFMIYCFFQDFNQAREWLQEKVCVFSILFNVRMNNKITYPPLSSQSFVW